MTTPPDLVESERLLSLVRDSSVPADDRARHCLTLGSLKRRETVPALLEIVIAEQNPVVHWQALSAIGMIGSKRAMRPLLQLLDHERSAAKRQGIVFALSLLHDERSRNRLHRVLSDQSEWPHTRGIAAEALGLLKPSQSSSRALIQALGDPNEQIRYSALCAVGALRDRSAVPAIQKLRGDTAVLHGEGSVGDLANHILRQIDEWVTSQKRPGC